MTDTVQDAPPSFGEITGLLADLPGPDFEAASAIAEHMARFAKREGAPGDMADWLDWLATWQASRRPRINQPRVSLFACTAGMAGPEGFQRNQARLLSHVEGRSVLHRLCADAPADLRVYDMTLEQPCADPATGAAVMSEPDCVQAMAYGMMAVEQGVDLLVLGGFSAGGTAHAAALAHALTGEAITDLPPAIGHWVEKAEAAHQGAESSPLAHLANLGLPIHAAMAGTILATRMARVPVILSDVHAMVAALLVTRLDKRAADHCRVQAHADDAVIRAMQPQLALPSLPHISGQMGEGVSAALMLPILKKSLTLLLPAEVGCGGKA